VWKEHEYTDRGKWMDGWETRRFRPADGVAPPRDSDIHDWCIIRLGMPGRVCGVVVDTAFFRGNYPDSCEIQATSIDDPLDLRALETATWTTILPRSDLQGNHKNKFEVKHTGRVTHLRLVIYPDGGVARLRVHGVVIPDWNRLGGRVDLAALENGAIVESCSDMFFGSRNNLIKQGSSHSMADGWETRRRRGPGNDWALVQLAATGSIDQLVLDTSHFKGNAPALAMVEGAFAARADEIEGWRVLLPKTPLQPHTRHVFDHQLRRIGDISHLKVSVFPCGGIARLRAWGTRVAEPNAGLAKLNALPDTEAIAALKRCCGSTRWATLMAQHRPFEDVAALLRIGERTWWSLQTKDHLEAFSAHPRIGEQKVPASGDSAWSKGEQQTASSASVETLAALAEANKAYESQLGFIFIVCATGRSADSMLADIRARLANSREVEVRTAAEEQAKITRLRLTKLMQELA
jgi:allantoicase